MNRRSAHVCSLALLVVLPLILLWPTVVGDRTFVPWDIGQFAPAATRMSAEEFAAATRDNNSIITETPAMFVPELRFMKSEFDRGVFPHWNPYSRSGTGLWSNSILGLWYPPNWILFFGGDPEADLGLLAWLSLVIAGLLMYGFLLHLGIRPSGAVFGAMVFALSGTLTVNLSFYQRVNALIWLPGLLWAIGVIAQREGYRRIPGMLALAACMYMAHVAGFPAFAIAVSVLSIVFTLYLLVGKLRSDGMSAAIGFGIAVATGAILGVLPSLVQTLPMFEFFPQSNRTMEPVDNILASGGYDPAGWLGYFCPTLFNHPFINHAEGLLDTYSPLFWSLYSRSSWVEQEGIAAGTVFSPNYNFCEYTVFVGTLTLFLAVGGLLHKQTPHRLLVVGLLGFLLLSASAGWWMEPILETKPLRWIPPPRYMGPVCMFLAFLAGWGVHALPQLSSGVRRGLWIAGYALGLTFAGCAGWAASHTPTELLEALTPGLQAKYADRFPHVSPEQAVGHIQTQMGPLMKLARLSMIQNFAVAAATAVLCATFFLTLPRILRAKFGHATVVIAVVVITAYELLQFGMPLCKGRELQGRPLNGTAVHAFLREQRDAHAATGGFSVFRAHDPKVRPGMVLPSQLPPDTLLNEHIRDQQAYTFVDNRSHLPFVKLYGWEHLIRGTWPYSVADSEKLALPFWDLLGIRFMLSEDVLQHAGKRVGPVLEGPGNGRKFYVYQRPHPLPRAWVVHDFRALGPEEGLHEREHAGPTAGGPAEDAIVTAMVAPEFRPRDEVLLDQPTAKALGAAPHRSKTAGNSREVRFPVAHQTSALTIEVAAGEPGYLVVNDTHMSGWTVTVNGAPATMHRGNLFQRMVVLPAEAAKVEFAYVTPGFVPGLWCLGVSALALLALAVLYLRRRRLTGAVPA